MARRRALLTFTSLVLACAPSEVPPDAPAERPDAGPSGVDAGTDAPPTDAGPVSLRFCPTTAAGDGCFVLTPAESGLPADGVNADVDQFALRPTDASAARGVLLLFLNGSGGSPRGAVSANPTTNWYTVARAQGLHVLGVSYRSDDTVGSLCAGSDACLLPTRTTILTGVYQDGAAAVLSDIRPDEGVYARLAAALATLDAGDPDGGWGDFLDGTAGLSPEAAIRWDRLMVSGHSQGGGHAAVLGRRHVVARVLMLASPCDSIGGAAASWLMNDGSYATDPTAAFFGLGAVGDPICRFPAAWTALGMPTTAGDADAVVCAGEDGHSAPLRCAENAPRWAAMLAP